MKKKLLAAATITLGLGFYAADSSAQIFRLKFTPDASLPSPMVDAINAEIKKVEDEINSDLPSADSPKRLMEGMANSSVMAGKGIGSDYASNMDVILIGAGVGVGADLEKNKEADTDMSGLGVQGGLVIGTNLGWMDTQKILGLETNKLNLYFNFLAFNTDQDLGDTKAKIDMTSFGVHASYDWIKGNNSKLWGWGGVKVHTGYEYNKTKLRFDSSIEEDISVTESGGTYAANLRANPFATIDASSHSIPIEISSSVRFLYLLSLYGGLGMDYNIGSAEGKGDLNSGGSTPVTCSGTCPGGSTAGTIETTANIDGKADVSPFLFRGFAGLQVHLPYVVIFGQVDKALGNDLVGATAGLRFVY
jgi:hypothetical protein